jgi:hypothetical protein
MAIFSREPRLELAEPKHHPFRDWLRETLGREADPSRRRLMASWLVSVVLHVLFGLLLLALVFSRPVAEKEGLWAVTTGLFDQGREQLNAETPEADLQLAQTGLTATPTPRAEAEDIGELSTPSPEVSPLDLRVIGVGAGAEQGDSVMLGLAGDAAGPRSEFFGHRGRGRRVVYVIDRSGSMLNSFEYLRRELKRSIRKLSYRQRQEFHVIFFNAGPVIESPPPKLVPAIRVYKDKAIEFLDQIVPEGGTEPGPAMQRAFELKPDLIYFLTDGEFDPVLLEHLARWNRDHKVKIFTIAFVFEGNSELLKRIAKENGGEYRLVDEHELGGW